MDGLSLENKLNIPESKYLVNIFTKSQVAKRKSSVINQQTNIDPVKMIATGRNITVVLRKTMAILRTNVAIWQNTCGYLAKKCGYLARNASYLAKHESDKSGREIMPVKAIYN